MIVQVAAKSKRGLKQIKRHGNMWMITRKSYSVSCLGGAAGVQLTSLKDKHVFWIKVEGDPNIAVLQGATT